MYVEQIIFADVAQLAEQLTCNQQVIGSSPIIGLAVLTVFGPLAQLVRATGSYPVGPGSRRRSRVRVPLRSFLEKRNTMKIWKFSSAGRASALQAEGHRFEPYNFHL